MAFELGKQSELSKQIQQLSQTNADEKQRRVSAETNAKLSEEQLSAAVGKHAEQQAALEEEHQRKMSKAQELRELLERQVLEAETKAAELQQSLQVAKLSELDALKQVRCEWRWQVV